MDTGMAFPMVAPAPSGASGMHDTQSEQEPALTSSADTYGDAGRATTDDISIGIAALAVRAAADTIGSKPAPIMVNSAKPQAQ